VIVVGLELVVDEAVAAARKASQGLGITVPTQLAGTVLTVHQGQFHDFEVIVGVDLPGRHGVATRNSLGANGHDISTIKRGSRSSLAGHALTVVAGTGADRAVAVPSTDGHTGTAVRLRHTVQTGNGRAAIITRTVQETSLEAGEAGGDVLEGIFDAGAF